MLYSETFLLTNSLFSTRISVQYIFAGRNGVTVRLVTECGRDQLIYKYAGMSKNNRNRQFGAAEAVLDRRRDAMMHLQTHYSNCCKVIYVCRFIFLMFVTSV